jgi:3-hydroxyisobutyrate dehydrogenase-like beta-hydroxyacid dehydrogenase
MIKLNKKINGRHLSVGFISSGYMGLPMIKNIIKSGFIMKDYDVNTKITKI